MNTPAQINQEQALTITDPVQSTFAQITHNAKMAAALSDQMMASMALVRHDMENIRAKLLDTVKVISGHVDTVTAVIDFIDGQGIEPARNSTVVPFTKRGFMSRFAGKH